MIEKALEEELEDLEKMADAQPQPRAAEPSLSNDFWPEPKPKTDVARSILEDMSEEDLDALLSELETMVAEKHSRGADIRPQEPVYRPQRMRGGPRAQRAQEQRWRY